MAVTDNGSELLGSVGNVSKLALNRHISTKWKVLKLLVKFSVHFARLYGIKWKTVNLVRISMLRELRSINVCVVEFMRVDGNKFAHKLFSTAFDRLSMYIYLPASKGCRCVLTSCTAFSDFLISDGYFDDYRTNAVVVFFPGPPKNTPYCHFLSVKPNNLKKSTSRDKLYTMVSNWHNRHYRLVMLFLRIPFETLWLKT